LFSIPKNSINIEFEIIRKLGVPLFGTIGKPFICMGAPRWVLYFADLWCGSGSY
jgi:hypothetical protein